MILVTGGTGFVGSHLVRRLLGQGRPVRCLLHNPAQAAGLLRMGAQIAYGDVTQPSTLAATMDGVEAVIHLVAVIRERGPATFEAVNHRGTANLVAAAEKAGVKRLLHLSVLGADSRSPYPYLRSKGMGEDCVRSSSLATTVLQSSLIFGEGDQFFTTLARLFRLAPLVPIVGSGRTLFQPIWVEDLVSCLLACLNNASTIGHTYTIGGPERISYEEMVDIVLSVLGAKRAKIHIPVPLMRPVAWLMDKALPNPPVTHHQLDLLAVENVAPKDHVGEVFGLTPKPLREGLAYLQGRLS